MAAASSESGGDWEQIDEKAASLVVVSSEAARGEERDFQASVEEWPFI